MTKSPIGVTLTHLPSVVALGLFVLAGARVSGQESRLILETRATVPTFDTARSNWTSDICGGKTLFASEGPRYEWTPVLDPADEYSSFTAVSGYALNAHRSGADVPMTHPFGGVDFNYLVLPDQRFETLLGPRNAERDGERNQAEAQANDLGIPILRGLLGVETDIGLVPEPYRVQTGDRVAVLGRWIVDCGHDNFLTELHPPLVTAFARPEQSGTVTKVQVIASPYLVSQEFDRGGLAEHLLKEVALVVTPFPGIPFSSRVEFRPRILPPVRDFQVFSFLVRAPAPASNPQDQLHARFQFSARSGVVVQPFWFDNETIAVIVLLTEQLTAAVPQPPQPWDISGTELGRLHSGAGAAWQGFSGILALFDLVKQHILNKGIRTRLYELPRVSPLVAGPIHEGRVSSPSWGQNPVHVDDRQPFPLIGWMEVMWRPPSTASRSTWGPFPDALIAVERPPASRTAEAAGAIQRRADLARVLQRVTPSTPSREPDGEWRLVITGRTPERARLWLRVTGNAIQGILETSNGRREDITGTVESSERFVLVRQIGEGRPAARLRVTRQGAGYVGSVEGNAGTLGKVQLIRP